MTETQARRIAAAAFVLLLHVAVIEALIFAMNLRQGSTATAPLGYVTEVLLRKVPGPALQTVEPPRATIAPQPAVPNIEIAPETPTASAVEGIGHALFGCDTDKLATASADERAKCLHVFFRRRQSPSLRLPSFDAESPYAREIARRNAPIVPMEHACTVQESPQANLGLPCYNLSGH